MNVIEFDHVSKSYQLGVSETSLREAIAGGVKDLFTRKKRVSQDPIFWAVKDVSYTVMQSETLGIIGHNGAGKSTMLKLLSRVTYPTSGHIHTHGRMAALIELGAGFHPDLTGRENVYLNGAILGLKKREIDAQFDSIVSFAGLEQFIDTPIKRYSSGMYVRLGFAVAAHVKADILLVDEVLSVGDMSFQEKSVSKMRELRDNGATIVFITHSMSAVRAFCNRVLLMDHGRLVASGRPEDVTRQYEQLQARQWRDHVVASTPASNGNGRNGPLHSPATDAGPIGQNGLSGQPRITKVILMDAQGNLTNAIDFGAGMKVCSEFVVPGYVPQPRYRIRVRRASDGVVCFTRSEMTADFANLHGEGVFEVYLPNPYLAPGKYVLDTYIQEKHGTTTVALSESVPFTIVGWEVEPGDGVYKPDAQWIVPAY